MIYSSQQEAQAAIMPQEHTSELQPIQQTMYRAYEYIVEQYGQFDKGIGAQGAHYAETNPFVNEGIKCANCVYYADNLCEIVQGSIAPEAICKFWIIPETKLNQGA